MQGPIIVIGGTNVDTGLPNLAKLSAPAGATVVNPLTSVVQDLVRTGIDVVEAESLVIAAFWLEGVSDLLHYDILAALDGDVAALAAQKIAAAARATTILTGALAMTASTTCRAPTRLPAALAAISSPISR